MINLQGTLCPPIDKPQQFNDIVHEVMERKVYYLWRKMMNMKLRTDGVSQTSANKVVSVQP